MIYNFKDRNLLIYENKILNNIIIHISLYNLKCDNTQIIRMKLFKYYIFILNYYKKIYIILLSININYNNIL